MLLARRLAAGYEALNAKYPIAVRGGGGIGLFFLGDVIAQRAQHVGDGKSSPNAPPRRPFQDIAACYSSDRLQDPQDPQPPRPPQRPWQFAEHWDGARTARACSWRALVWAPVAHFFWLGLEKHVSPHVVHLGTRGTVIKIAIDFVVRTAPISTFEVGGVSS